MLGNGVRAVSRRLSELCVGFKFAVHAGIQRLLGVQLLLFASMHDRSSCVMHCLAVCCAHEHNP